VFRNIKFTSMTTTTKNINGSLNDCFLNVINIDCSEYMRSVPDGYFDLGICDIPYGLNVSKMAFTRETKTLVRQKNGSRLNFKRKTYPQKDWDLFPPNQEYFDELKRICKHQIIFGIEYVNWEGVGNGRIKWNKGVSDKVSFKGYELAYCSMIEHVDQIDLLWSGFCQAKSLSEPMVQQGNKKLNEKRIHPTQKPVLLYKKS